MGVQRPLAVGGRGTRRPADAPPRRHGRARAAARRGKHRLDTTAGESSRGLFQSGPDRTGVRRRDAALLPQQTRFPIHGLRTNAPMQTAAIHAGEQSDPSYQRIPITKVESAHHADT